MLHPDISNQQNPPPPPSFFRKVLNATFGGALAGATEVAVDHPF